MCKGEEGAWGGWWGGEKLHINPRQRGQGTGRGGGARPGAGGGGFAHTEQKAENGVRWWQGVPQRGKGGSLAPGRRSPAWGQLLTSLGSFPPPSPQPLPTSP